MTWLYIRNSGNVLLTSLFHAAQSFFVIVNDGIPSEQQAWLMAGVYLAMALVVVIAAGPRFARTSAHGNVSARRVTAQPSDAMPAAHAHARPPFD
jgi:hypothetical protein